MNESNFEHVQFIGENTLSHVLAESAEESIATPSDSGIYNERIWSGSTIETAPSEIQSLVDRPSLLGSMKPDVDRLLALEVVRFEGAVRRVRYQLSGLSGFVEVPEWNHLVMENPLSLRPLLVRRRRMAFGSAVTIIAGLLVALAYGLRHPFFTSVPNFRWLGGLAFITGFLILPLLALWALPRQSRRGLALVAAPVLTAVALQAGLAATGKPSLEHARELARSGELERALFVSSACADLEIKEEEARHFHDRLQLTRIADLDDPRLAWDATGWPFLTSEGHQQAAEHAVQVTAHAAAARQSTGDWEGSEAVLGIVPSELQDSKPISGLRWEAGAHRVETTWQIIRSKESLDERLGACRRIHQELDFLDRFSSQPRASPISRSKVDKACDSLEAERKREIDRQRRAEERERERKERAAAAAHRAWAYAPLLCRDGTLSPSCVCGQDSRRGCCSHHSGVGGCSRPYPN